MNQSTRILLLRSPRVLTVGATSSHGCPSTLHSVEQITQGPGGTQQRLGLQSFVELGKC